MKPFVLTADQVRIAYQADSFLTHLANEELPKKADIDLNVGFRTYGPGVRMSVGVQAANNHIHLVRRVFSAHDSTSAIYYGSVEMVKELVASLLRTEPDEEDKEPDTGPEWPKVTREGLAQEIVEHIQEWPPASQAEDFALADDDEYEPGVGDLRDDPDFYDDIDLDQADDEFGEII